MKILKPALFLLLSSLSVFAFSDTEILKYNAKVGFVNGEDTIEAYKFLEDEKKIFLLGDKNLQIWDVANEKLLHSIENPSWRFSPDNSFFNAYMSYSIPYFQNWKNYAIDSNGKWLVTTEKIGGDKSKSIVVRDLKELKQISSFNLPNFSIESIYLDESKNEIYGFARGSGFDAMILIWDSKSFQLKKSLAVDDYKWHQFIGNGEKAIVGSGDTKLIWTDSNVKQGDRLTLRDMKTGAVEKEFTAENLKPRTPFRETTVTNDEKYLISTRDSRAFVWEIGGDGKPRFEIADQSFKDDFRFERLIGSRYIAEKVNKKLRIYELAGNGTPKFELVSNTPNDSVNLIDKTSDGKYMVVADDRKIRVLETAGNGKSLFEVATDSETEKFKLIKILEEKNYLLIGRINWSEKKPERTEIYDITTGNLLFTVPTDFTTNVKFTPDETALYDDRLSGMKFFNFDRKEIFLIKVKFTNSYTDSSNPLNSSAAESYERIALSPDGKFALKYGYRVVSIYNAENGDELQTLFDPQQVQYSKKTNRIKNSGLADTRWSEDGKFVYGLDENLKTINFWKVR